MDEQISKKAALVAVKDALMAWSYMPEWRDGKILEAIAELPSTQPTFDARDTQYNLPIGTDCISRQQAIDALAAMYCKSDEDGYVWIIRRDAWARIDALPSAEPKKGKWIRDGHHIRCDQCGMYMCDTDREGDRIPTEFCPSCGADMRQREE